MQVVLAYIPFRGLPRDPSATALLAQQAQASHSLTAAALGRGAGLHRRISVSYSIRANIILHQREIKMDNEFELTLRSPGAASGASSSRALSYTRPFDDIAHVEKDEEEGKKRVRRAVLGGTSGCTALRAYGLLRPLSRPGTRANPSI